MHTQTHTQTSSLSVPKEGEKCATYYNGWAPSPIWIAERTDCVVIMKVLFFHLFLHPFFFFFWSSLSSSLFVVSDTRCLFKKGNYPFLSVFPFPFNSAESWGALCMWLFLCVCVSSAKQTNKKERVFKALQSKQMPANAQLPLFILVLITQRGKVCHYLACLNCASS